MLYDLFLSVDFVFRDVMEDLGIFRWLIVFRNKGFVEVIDNKRLFFGEILWDFIFIDDLKFFLIVLCLIGGFEGFFCSLLVFGFEIKNRKMC